LIFAKPNVKRKPDLVPETHYVPFTIGSPKASLPNTWEFLVVGKNEAENQNTILSMLIAHKARIISHFSCASNDNFSFFSMFCIVDASKMDCDCDDLLIRLRKMKFVVRAEKASMNRKFFSNFAFPITLMNEKNPSIVLDAKTLFQILNNSPAGEKPRAYGRSRHEELGREYAFQIVQSLRHSASSVYSGTPNDVEKALIDSIKTYFRAVGWGLLNFGLDSKILNDNNTEVSTVSVSELPDVGSVQESSAEDESPAPWIRFMKGVVSGLLEVIAPQSYTKILGQTFNKYNRTLTFFVVESDPANKTKTQDPERESASTQKEEGTAEREFVHVAETIPLPVEERWFDSDDPAEWFREPSYVPFVSASTGPAQQPKIPALKTPPSIPPDDDIMGNSELVRRILVASKKASTKVHIMNRAGISFSRGNRYLDRLTTADLIEAKTLDDGMDTRVYQITSKGAEFLETKERLDRMMNRDPSDFSRAYR
jgi:predicted transcriptional regulator